MEASLSVETPVNASHPSAAMITPMALNDSMQVLIVFDLLHLLHAFSIVCKLGSTTFKNLRKKWQFSQFGEI